MTSDFNFRYLFKFNFTLSLFFVSSIAYTGCQSVTEPVSQPKSRTITNLQKLETNESELKINMDEVFPEMKNIAKGLAILFKQEEFRKIFENQKMLANNREDIIDASVFLNLVVSIKENNEERTSTILDELMNRNNVENKEAFYKKYKNLSPGILDIYFPIREHRAKWTSSLEDMYVAAIDRRESKKKDGKVTAFNTDGKLITWGKDEVPERPVLVVTLSELHGKYPPKIVNRTNGVNLSRVNKEKTDQIVNLAYYEPPAILKNDLIVYAVFLRDWQFNGEWIWDGDPELYTVASYYGLIDGQQVSISQTTYFFEIVDEHHYFPQRVVLSLEGNVWGSSRWVTWMEEDGGWLGSDDLLENQWAPNDGGPASPTVIYELNQVHTNWGANIDLWMDVYERITSGQ